MKDPWEDWAKSDWVRLLMSYYIGVFILGTFSSLSYVPSPSSESSRKGSLKEKHDPSVTRKVIR